MKQSTATAALYATATFCVAVAIAFIALVLIAIENTGYRNGRHDECVRQNPNAVECIEIDGWWEPVYTQP